MSTNSPRFSAAELLDAAGGEWLRGIPGSDLSVYTDSRESGEGKMFLALSGERFDGHAFLAAAEQAGAAALCIAADRADAVPAGCALPVLAVKNTLTAWQRIARFHRLRFPGLKLAAVTGSVGKTSVKEMLRAVFSAAAGDENAVLYTLENTNNQVGVPLNLMRLTAEHRYAVIEMGSNRFGEIAPLSFCAAPDAALVNSIAPCHLEFFRDLDGVALEKSAVWSALRPGGTACMPAESPGHELLEAAASRHPRLTFGFTGSRADVTAEYEGGNLNGSVFSLHFPDKSSHRVRWRLSGRHQALNAAAAASTALALGIPPAVIAAGLAETRLPGMRGKQIRIGNTLYINDAYNASPAGMLAGMEMLAEALPDGSGLLLVLGTMRELGAGAEKEHLNVYRAAREKLPRAKIVLIGEGFAATGCPEWYADAETAAHRVAELAAGCHTVFAKGSRGTRVELALPPEAR